MKVSRSSKAVLGVLLSLLIAGAIPVKAEKEDSKKERILAGPIGKSSSASARITLIIPPRPDSKQETTESRATTEKPENSVEPERKQQ